MRYILALTIASVALGGVGVLLFAVAERGRGQPQQNFLFYTETLAFYSTARSALSDSWTPLRSETNVQSEKAVLDNDQDHEGNYDGTTNPLAALAVTFAVLSMAFVLRALVGGRFLLAFCQIANLSSLWLQVLEHPG